ncbi:MAG: hypothetical protein WCR72_09580, partial [Bacteroidota bacterium]
MKKSLLFLSLFFLGIALWGQNGRFENNTTAKNSTINVPSTGNINPAHQGSGTTHFPVSITGIKTVPANPPSAAVVKTSVKNPSVTPGSTSNPMDNPPTPESEACGADLNGGCNMTIPAFEPIAFGESIAGTSWCDLSTRDTDWFIFTLTSGSTVTLTGQAEFPFTIGFIAAPCPAISFIDYTFGAAGETKSVTVALAAGTYYAWVGPSSWSTYIDCSGSNTYQISLSGTDECTGDVTPPVAIAKNISVPLNAAGTASITAADIDNGSTDNCAIASRAASKTAFACADKGPNNVTLTVTDLSGNTATANSVVTVVDAINPVAIVKNISITLNTLGMATITAADIDNGSTDNCAITSRAASKTTFACADLGANTVKLTVSDA